MEKENLGILKIESGKIIFSISPAQNGTLKITWNGREFTEGEFEELYEKHVKSQTPPKPEGYEGVRKRLRNRLKGIAVGFRFFGKDEGYIIKELRIVLGDGMYFSLKIEVVQQVVNEMFPKVEECFPYIISEDGRIQQVAFIDLGASYYYQGQAAELALKLLNEKYFDGDITLDEWRKG